MDDVVRKIEVRLLGLPTILVDGQPLFPKGSKHHAMRRALLFAFTLPLIRGEPYPKDRWDATLNDLRTFWEGYGRPEATIATWRRQKAPALVGPQVLLQALVSFPEASGGLRVSIGSATGAYVDIPEFLEAPLARKLALFDVPLRKLGEARPEAQGPLEARSAHWVDRVSQVVVDSLCDDVRLIREPLREQGIITLGDLERALRLAGDPLWSDRRVPTTDLIAQLQRLKELLAPPPHKYLIALSCIPGTFTTEEAQAIIDRVFPRDSMGQAQQVLSTARVSRAATASRSMSRGATIRTAPTTGRSGSDGR